MFGIGPGELVFILVIALLVLGPKRLPDLAAGIGKGLAEFRRATADINAELDEARRSLEDQAREATRTTQPVSRTARTTRTVPRNPAAAGAPAPAESPAHADDAATQGEQVEQDEPLEQETHKKDRNDPDPTASA